MMLRMTLSIRKDSQYLHFQIRARLHALELVGSAGDVVNHTYNQSEKGHNR